MHAIREIIAPWTNYALTGIVGVLLGATAIAASYVPARRAARVDPVEALRVE